MRDYNELLPIDGRILETFSKGKWETEVTDWPEPSQGKERLRYGLAFRDVEGSKVRYLKLWVYSLDLSVDRWQRGIIEQVREWLEWREGDAELTLTLDRSTGQVRAAFGSPAESPH